MSNDERPLVTGEEADLLKVWFKLALDAPPSPASWSKFVATLRLVNLRQQRTAGKVTSYTLTSPAIALIELVSAYDAEVAAACRPLLEAVLESLTGSPPDLFSRPAGKAGAPPMRTTEALIMGTAARAVEELCACGNSRSDAAARVLKAMKKGGVAGSARCTTRKILGWRERLSEGLGRVPPVALHRYQTALPKRYEGRPPSEKAAFLLGLLQKRPLSD